jgi:cell division protein FtsB
MALWESKPEPKKRPVITRRPGTGAVGRDSGSSGSRPGEGGSNPGWRDGRSGSGVSGGSSGLGGRSGSAGRGGQPGSGGKRSIVSGGSLRDYPFLRQFYQHQAVISDGLQKFLFLLVIATLIYAFVLGNGGAIRIFMLRHKTAELDQKIARLQSNVETLSQEIERLKSDPFSIEKVGREKLGLIKPGDEVIKIVPRDRESRALDQ